MANTYKDIIITPNRNSNTAEPNISFRGGNTASNTEITLRVYPDSNGTLSFEGSAGQLFSITNDLTGVLFSVGDISGIPSAEIYANGIIRFAEYSGNVVIGNATSINSALTVAGNLWVSTGINAATINATTVNAQTYLTSTGANVFLTAINAANTVRVSQNGASTLSGKQLNFVNTANVTIAVTDAGDGNANVEIFSAAGGGGGGGVVIVRDNFTGDGNTTNFTLSTEPVDQNHVLVFVDLVFQSENAFSVSGDTLAFATAPDNGANVDVYIYGGGVGSTVVTSDVFTGTGACTSYQLTQTATAARTFVYLDGVAQRPQYDYQVSGTTLSFNVAPANTSVIEVRTLSAFNTVDINVAPVTIYSDKFTGTGSCTEFTLTQSGTTDSTFVFLNGVSQKPGTNYTVGGVGNNILTMASAPANGSILEVRSMGPFKIIENQSRIDSDIFSGDGNTVSFTLSTASTTKKTLVFIDGVAQKPITDYSVGGSTITFVEAPPDGTFIEVRSISPFIFATSTGDLAYGQANLAFSLANTANTQANLAYDAANNRVLKAGDTMTGNLTFSGTGLRILGDFSYSNTANSLLFQTTTTNGLTAVGAIPNGTSKVAIFRAHDNSNPVDANVSFVDMYINSNGSTLRSYNANLSNTLPLTFSVAGERMRIDKDGNIGIGTASPNTTLHVNGTITLQEVKEKVNVSATALGANLTIDVLSGAVTYLTANATANSTVNFRGNSTVSMNTFMATGQSLTTAIMITNGATAYRIANVQIDGTSITPKWAGGSAPTASANSVDTYAFTIIKTGSSAYTVLGSKTQFA